MRRRQGLRSMAALRARVKGQRCESFLGLRTGSFVAWDHCPGLPFQTKNVHDASRTGQWSHPTLKKCFTALR